MRTWIAPSNVEPFALGEAHGKAFADEIHRLARIRKDLTLAREQWSSEAELQRVAAEHVALLDAYDADLAAEMRGIAAGAGASLEDVIILNHYTDFRDIDPRAPIDRSEGTEDVGGDEGCTVVYSPATSGPLLAMTWDTHFSASQFLLMLGLPRRSEGGRQVPAAWAFTISGCVAMAGYNELGLSVVINNLISTDARVGVPWPVLIRAILRCESVDEAKELVETAPLGSGHHYVIADRSSVVAIETSGELRAQTFDDAGSWYHHTNHCVNDEISERVKIAPTSTTLARYADMKTQLEASQVSDLEDLWQRFGVVCYPEKPGLPHGVATCGLFAGDLNTARAYALKGYDHTAERVALSFSDGGEPLARPVKES